MNVAEMQSQTVATEYNGWSNYETWLANLWLTNDESNYVLLQEALSKDMWRTYEQAEWLEMMLRYELDDEIDEPCLWQDLLRAAFGRIDWSYRLILRGMTCCARKTLSQKPRYLYYVRYSPMMTLAAIALSTCCEMRFRLL